MALLLLLLIPAGLVTVAGAVGYSLSTLARAGVRRTGRAVWFRCAAWFLVAAAAAVYTFGLLAVALTVLDAEDGGADSSPLRPCRTPGQWQRALHVVDYTVDYVPLRFVCRTNDGEDYAADSVPGYVNPAALGLALAAAACGGVSAYASERRARTAPAA